MEQLSTASVTSLLLSAHTEVKDQDLSQNIAFAKQNGQYQQGGRNVFKLAMEYFPK